MHAIQRARDKAAALEAYARQAENVDAERKACEIRLRAERKAGDLLQGMRWEQGKRTDTLRNAGAKSEYRTAITDAGIPARTADRYQALARVPEQQFEAALAVIATDGDMSASDLWVLGQDALVLLDAFVSSMGNGRYSRHELDAFGVRLARE